MEGSLVAYKVFTNGSVLNASELNEFLMNQSVITFSNSTARGSAITTPVEGMITYLEDTQTYESWDGAAWVAFGGGGSAGTQNAIINGAFEINQRNFTSVSGSAVNQYGFDRFSMQGFDGTNTFSSQAFTLGSAPVAGYEAKNFFRAITTGQSAASAQTVLQQRIESVRTFAGETITLSFFAKAASGTPKISVELAQNFGTGGSPSAANFKNLGDVTLTTSFQRYSLTGTIDSIAGKTLGTNNDDSFAVKLFFSAGSDFNARTGTLGIQSNTFDIWGVQLEPGSTATTFRRNANSLQGELAACQRYYYREVPIAAGSRLGVGYVINATGASALTSFPVQMRVAPTALETSGTAADYSVVTGNTITACSSIPSFGSTTTSIASATFSVASGLTTSQAIHARAASENAFLGWSAEL
jgi:hypothetical protein